MTEQDGALFRAEKTWKVNPGGTPGSVHGKLVSEAVEPLIGVIDFDGRTIYLAEQGDFGTYTARLTTPTRCKWSTSNPATPPRSTASS